MMKYGNKYPYFVNYSNLVPIIICVVNLKLPITAYYATKYKTLYGTCPYFHFVLFCCIIKSAQIGYTLLFT